MVTILASWQVIKRGKKKIEDGKSEITTIVGASMIENVTITELTYALREHCDIMEKHMEVMSANCAAMTRQTDLDLIQSGKLDFRDRRDQR